LRSGARKADRATGSSSRRGLRRPGTASSSARWGKRERRRWGTRRRAYRGCTGAVAVRRQRTRATGGGARWRRRSDGLQATGTGEGGVAWIGETPGKVESAPVAPQATNRRRPGAAMTSARRVWRHRAAASGFGGGVQGSRVARCAVL
jgi:hypothetical protein